MTSDKRDDKKMADLTGDEPASEISDAELEQVAGGLSRTTLSTSTISKVSPSTNLLQPKVGGLNAETVYGGVGNDDLLNIGSTQINPFKR